MSAQPTGEGRSARTQAIGCSEALCSCEARTPHPPLRGTFSLGEKEATPPSDLPQHALRHLAFEVDDIDEAAEEIRLLGVLVEPIRTDDLTGKRFTFFADPDGLPLELYER